MAPESDEHVREVFVWVHPGFSVQLRMTPDYRELLESTAEFLDLMKKNQGMRARRSLLSFGAVDPGA